MIDLGALAGDMIDPDVVLPQEAFAADMHVIAVDLAFDAEADPVFGFVAMRQLDVELADFLAQRFRHRMLQVGFRRHRQRQQMLGRDVRMERQDIDHMRRAVTEGAGLVEHHRIDVRQLLHMAAALDDDAGARRMRH